MAVDRVGATMRPLSIPDRQPGQPVGAVRGPLDARDSALPFPLRSPSPSPSRSPSPSPQPNPLSPPPQSSTPTPFEAMPLPGRLNMLLDAPDGLPPAQQAHQTDLEALATALADLPGALEQTAMRPNQVFLSRQMVWHTPDTAMMAASWMTMVRTYGEQRAAWLQQANGQHVPSSLFMAEHTPSALREGRPGLPLVTEMEPWRFAVFAWGAERLVLRVVVKEDEQSERLPRRRGRAALRLELMLPGLGRIVIQMEPAPGNGVVMEVGAAHTSAMQHMREILPQLAASVGRGGLTILRCRLRRELPPVSGEYPGRAHVASLTPAIFRAMAQMAVMLSQPLPADELSFDPL